MLPLIHLNKYRKINRCLFYFCLVEYWGSSAVPPLVAMEVPWLRTPNQSEPDLANIVPNSEFIRHHRPHDRQPQGNRNRLLDDLDQRASVPHLHSMDLQASVHPTSYVCSNENPTEIVRCRGEAEIDATMNIPYLNS